MEVLAATQTSINGKNVYTVELIDVNEDGFPDLLIAGHEHEGVPTPIYWWNCSGVYNVSDKSGCRRFPGSESSWTLTRKTWTGTVFGRYS